MSRQAKRTRTVYIALAVVVVVGMATVGLLPLINPDAGASPTSTFPTPPPGTPSVPLAPAPYVHETGYFQINPPEGWRLTDSTTGEVVSASWVGQQSVVHAFVRIFDAPLVRDELIEYVQTEFGGGFGNYDDYTVVNQNYDEEPLRIDFEVALQEQGYLAREWAGAEENLAWVLRIVVPDNYPALLGYLGERVLPTYHIYPDAVPQPPDWQTFTDRERGYTFKHPPDWANHGTGSDGARRFVDAPIDWQAEMAVRVQPEASLDSEGDAEAWLEAIEPGAKVRSVAPASRVLGEGYLISFTYPEDRRGVLLLLNANEAVYSAALYLPPGSDDPLDEEAQARAEEALRVLEGFMPIQVEDGIPTPTEAEG